MLDGAAQEHKAEAVLRLVALPTAEIEALLLRRGHDPDSIDDIKAAIASVGLPFTLDEAVSFPFKPGEGPLPYSVGRFGNGQYPVFYSALTDVTCVQELRYHNQDAFEQQRSGQVPFDRYYQLIACDFAGPAMMLVGLEGQYSDLVSTTEAGYPFCQRVAQWSVGEGAEALHTRSARDDEGTCVPVFRRATLDNARALHRVRFWAHDEQIAHEIVPHT